MRTPDLVIADVQAHFASAPFIGHEPTVDDWTDQHFLGAESLEELGRIFEASNDFLVEDDPGHKIPDDTLGHETQHLEALDIIAKSKGVLVEARAGILVARHRRVARIMHGLGRYTVLPAAVLPDGLSSLEIASVAGYPDEPFKTDRLQMKRCGFDSVNALGDALLAHNAEHAAAPLPIPRSYT